MLSALQHYLYCPRQCALIYVEQIWMENEHTAEGRQLHKTAHTSTVAMRGDCKTVTGLWLQSEALGLVGQADVVEFYRQDGVWRPYPVEYKRGRPKSIDADRVQLCAQALCLEEMLGQDIPEGALFYGKTKRRTVVSLDERLRKRTMATIEDVRNLLLSGVTPPPPGKEQIDSICPNCSLLTECMPLASNNSAVRYLQSIVENV